MDTKKLTDFIDAALIEIPVADTDLRNQLKAIKESVAYAAPEILGGWKSRLGQILYQAFNSDGVERQDWHHRVSLMWENLR